MGIKQRNKDGTIRVTAWSLKPGDVLKHSGATVRSVKPGPDPWNCVLTTGRTHTRDASTVVARGNTYTLISRDGVDLRKEVE